MDTLIFYMRIEAAEQGPDFVLGEGAGKAVALCMDPVPSGR